jgi:hypothetical protein
MRDAAVFVFVTAPSSHILRKLVYNLAEYMVPIHSVLLALDRACMRPAGS